MCTYPGLHTYSRRYSAFSKNTNWQLNLWNALYISHMHTPSTPLMTIISLKTFSLTNNHVIGRIHRSFSETAGAILHANFHMYGDSCSSMLKVPNYQSGVLPTQWITLLQYHDIYSRARFPASNKVHETGPIRAACIVGE